MPSFSHAIHQPGQHKRKNCPPREVYDVKPIEKKFGFAFSPTGTVDPFSAELKSTKLHGTDAFNAILTSAYKARWEPRVRWTPVAS